MSHDDRLTALETALMHQDQTIHELSDMLRKQWDAIDALKREIRRLEETKADMAEDPSADRPPPHY